MKNIYNVTTGQLLSFWGYGIVLWLFSFVISETHELLGGYFIITIPFSLIFYTIGWFDYKKNN